MEYQLVLRAGDGTNDATALAHQELTFVWSGIGHVFVGAKGDAWVMPERFERPNHATGRFPPSSRLVFPVAAG